MVQKEKITILDIARRTGLSKGTVDRVLHNRGEVSRRSYDKVMAAIEELRIHHAEREAALVKLRSASGMEERLERMGSKVTSPQEPATIIKKR